MAASPVSPLVLTKLRLPAPRARLVQRERLVERLDMDTGASLLLLCAPAGYGKTTLLAEWARSLREQGAAVAWFAIDRGDDDPLCFASYLVASLAQAIGPIPELAQVAGLLRSSPEIDLQRILPDVINAVASCGRECILILDDYHLVSSPAIHSAVAYLVDHLPENAHIAIGARADPPLPLARLRGQGRLLEVRTPSLRFTLAETDFFLSNIMHLDLAPDIVALLETRTEGWVAGLQLLSLACGPDPDRLVAALGRGHRYLADYLFEEVFNRLPPEEQSFLLATSILERMCAGVCEAVTQAVDTLLIDPLSVIRPEPPVQQTASRASESPAAEPGANALSILERLDRSNLFVVALDDQGVWYRYHHLFRDFLLARLRRSHPERVPTLHRAACEWLAANSFLREAAAHAFQAQDWEYAAAFVEQHAFTLLIHSELASIYEWCAVFPEDVMAAHPQLCIMQCWPLVFRFRSENRPRVEARLQMAEQAIAALAGAQPAAELAEHAAVVRSFLSMAPDPAADAGAQLALARSAIGSYPSGHPGQFSGLLAAGYAYLALLDTRSAEDAFTSARQVARRGGLYFGVVESSFQLARLSHNQGRLRRVAEICRQAQADVTAMYASVVAATNDAVSTDFPEQEFPALGCLDIALGCALLEQDHLNAAEEHLLQGLERIGQRMNPYYLLIALVALFHLREFQRRPAEALAFLDRLDAAWPDIAFCTNGLRVVHALRLAREGSARANALAAAAGWLRAYTPASGTPLPGMGPFGAAEAFYLAGLAWYYAQVAVGNTQAALPYIARQLERAAAGGLDQRVIELSLLEAQAAEVGGDHARAMAALERALSLARPEGHLRIFDQGALLTRLLGEAATQGLARDDARRVLAAITAPAAASAAAESPSGLAHLVEPLSERELDVLRLMATGATNQAIAGTLVITVGTVKSHINHILGKLGARNRTEAVARAREYRLI
jgi:LuxR family maltose regulon positive regulatory protein